MRRVVLLVALAGCQQVFGLDDPRLLDAPVALVDARNTVVLSGHTYDVTGMMLPDVVLTWQTDPVGSILATATSATDASFQLVIPYNGTPLVGYVKGTHANYLDSYYYPEAPPATDEQLSLPLATQTTVSGLCAAVQVTCDSNLAIVVLAVIDHNAQRVADVHVSTTPSGTVKYDDLQGPSPSATMTSTDGQAYVLNVAVGQLSVTATLPGWTFVQHSMVARAGVFNLTQIVGAP